MFEDVHKENSENLKKILDKRIDAKRISKMDKFLVAGFGGALSSSFGLALTGVASPELAVAAMAVSSAGFLAAMFKSKNDGDKKAKSYYFTDYVVDMEHFKVPPQQYATKHRLNLEQKKEFFRGILPPQDMKTRLTQTFEELPTEVKIWGDMADKHFAERAERKQAEQQRAAKRKIR